MALNERMVLTWKLPGIPLPFDPMHPFGNDPLGSDKSPAPARSPTSASRASLDRFEKTKDAKSPMRKQWDYFAGIVRANGGLVCPHGRPTVLGLRHIDQASTSYGDSFVVLSPDHRVQIFKGSTHPSESTSSESPDVTGDGVGDVGMLRPGSYAVVPNGPHDGKPSFHVLTRNGSGYVPGWRDTDQDGGYSMAERSASEKRGDRLSEILFHVGQSDGPSSIGCMNVPPEVYDDFVKAVGGGGKPFSFTLVDRTQPRP
jgi:hypothetical protein